MILQCFLHSNNSPPWFPAKMRALGLGWSGIYIASEVSNTGRVQVQSRQTPGSSGCDPNLGVVRFVSDLFKGEKCISDLHGDQFGSRMEAG